MIAFLEQYPFLGPLLVEAHDHIHRYFEEPQLLLEVVIDPEAIDADRLVAYVATRLSVEEALDRLHQLDEGWWLDAFERGQRKLLIDVDFLPASDDV